MKKQRIFLVDDNPLDMHMFRIALYDANIRADLEMYSNASEAIRRVDAAEDKLADFAILDLSLKDGSGLDVLTSIRKNIANRWLPVIVFSGSDRPEDVQLAYALGANAYIVKPLEFAEQVDVVRQMRAFWVDHVRTP